jgi:hypothetical protein
VDRAGGYQTGGQQIPQQLPVLGISSFDQGIRIANATLAENLRGNENRDTRGTRRWDVESTVRLEHLRVGQIVLFRYQAINLQPLVSLQSPPGTNISGILCRVENIKPTTNFERVTATLVWHEDYWYTDAYGQHATPPYSNPGQTLPSRRPYAWDHTGSSRYPAMRFGTPPIGDSRCSRTTGTPRTGRRSRNW